jgi:hypothetical protein
VSERDHRFEDGERVLVRSRYVSDRNNLVPGVFKATWYEHVGWRYEVTTEHGTFDVPLHGIQKIEPNKPLDRMAALQVVTGVMADHAMVTEHHTLLPHGTCVCGEDVQGDYGQFDIHLLVMAYEKGRADAC